MCYQEKSPQNDNARISQYSLSKIGFLFLNKLFNLLRLCHLIKIYNEQYYQTGFDEQITTVNLLKTRLDNSGVYKLMQIRIVTIKSDYFLS